MYKLIVKGTPEDARIAIREHINSIDYSIKDVRNLPGWMETFVLIQKSDWLHESTLFNYLNMWMNEHRYPPFIKGDLLWWGRTDDEYQEEPVLEGVTIITADGTGKGNMYADDHLEMDYEDRYHEDTESLEDTTSQELLDLDREGF